MSIRAVTVDAGTMSSVAAPESLAGLADRYTLGLVTTAEGEAEPSGLCVNFAFRLVTGSVGIAAQDPRIFAMAAAAVPCRAAELVHVGEVLAEVEAARAAGAHAVWFDRTGRPSARPAVDATITMLSELAAVIDALDVTSVRSPVGVGPHPRPWPADSHLDPQLLAGGDRRNVVDRYRYWRTEAVVADLDTRRHPFHVAIENWQHDLNIGTVVRNANAFLASSVRVVGRRRWNRRGAMVTDRYQHVAHHASIEDLTAWASGDGLAVVAVDNLPGALPIDRIELPSRCVLLFGQEGGGLTSAARDAAELVCSIRQFGSTRSINAGVASGIAMHAWTTQHAPADRQEG